MTIKDDANLEDSTDNHNLNTDANSNPNPSNNDQASSTHFDSNSKNKNKDTDSHDESTTTTNTSFGSSKTTQKDSLSNSPNVQSDAHYYTNPAIHTLTKNYFCFDCGAIMTTLEDKYQHSLVEAERLKKQDDLEH